MMPASAGAQGKAFAASAPPPPVNERAHWQAIHEENFAQDVSWFQSTPTVSLRLLADCAVGPEARVLDVGCGQAGVAGALVEKGFRRVTSLDISPEALRRARDRLGARSAAVEWIEADVLDYAAPEPFDVWHDRALLHFFAPESDQRRYVASLERNLARGGLAVIAGFAKDGPEKCSGLPVVRRDAAGFVALLGPGWELVGTEHEDHMTPWGKRQAFQWAAFRRR